MAKYDGITADYVRQVLEYNPKTGLLLWKKRSLEMFNGNWRVCNRWNGHFAGKPAGNLSLHRGYIEVRLEGHLYKAHILIWLIVTGQWPTDEIDHDDGHRANNIWTNLKEVTPKGQSQNVGVRKDSSSGVTGVSFSSTHKLWEAYVSVNKVRHHKWFKTKEEAIFWRAGMKGVLHEVHPEQVLRKAFSPTVREEISLDDL